VEQNRKETGTQNQIQLIPYPFIRDAANLFQGSK
jgi:hypothetical protein